MVSKAISTRPDEITKTTFFIFFRNCLEQVCSSEGKHHLSRAAWLKKRSLLVKRKTDMSSSQKTRIRVHTVDRKQLKGKLKCAE